MLELIEQNHATTIRIPENGFETYEAGSRIINVFSPGHGLTNGTTYRFRGHHLA
jgi:hypothetical protein